MTKIKSFVVQNWAKIILVFLIFIYVLTFSFFSIRRHQAFASGYDLANMDQTIWNTAHGNFFTLSGKEADVSRFNYHADLILTIISPLYLIFDSVWTLLIVQSAVIGLGALPAYFLARKVLNSKAKALVIAFVYLINYGVQWSNIYDFHGVTLAMTFLLSSFYFAYIKKWNWMYIFVVLSLLTKEEVSFFIILLGVYTFLFLKEKAKGKILFFGGIAWFMMTVFYLIPINSENGRYWVWDWYKFSQRSGGSQPFVPFDLIKKIFHKEAIAYYFQLLKPFGYLPLLGLPWLILVIPEILINVLSEQGQMKSMVFHYQSVIIVGLVIATIFSWKYLSVLLKKWPAVSWLIGGWILLAAVRTFYHYGPLPSTPSYWRPMYTVTQDEVDFENAIGRIPANAVVSASSEARNHLTHRREAYTLPNIPTNVEYIVMVDQTRVVGDYSLKSFETDLIAKIDKEGGWNLIYHSGHFYIYQKSK